MLVGVAEWISCGVMAGVDDRDVVGRGAGGSGVSVDVSDGTAEGCAVAVRVASTVGKAVVGSTIGWSSSRIVIKL